MFTRRQEVLFRHCDPAGIVFYPRYFEMMNDTVEAWFAEMGAPFAEMHRNSGGVPTAAISTEFSAPSRHGDVLEISITVTRLGRTSVGIETRATSGGETRFVTTQTLVNIDKAGRPQPWTDALRAKLNEYQNGDA